MFCGVDRHNIVLMLLIYNIVFFKLFFVRQPYTCLANLQFALFVSLEIFTVLHLLHKMNTNGGR